MNSVIKVLFLAANPLINPRLGLDEEIRAIAQVVSQSRCPREVDIIQEWAVRAADLQRHLLQHKPNIVHFSAHGSELGELILEDELRNPQPVSSTALKRLFSLLKGNIECVVLNTCYSERQAKAISKSVPYVIGTSNIISDSTAIAFATAFYQAIAFDKDIKTAFDLGCVQIELENPDKRNVTKLISRRNKAINQTDTQPRVVFDTSAPLEASEQHLDKTIGDTFLRQDLPQIVNDFVNAPGVASLSVLMMDIDDLSIINKVYGTRVGDEVLKVAVDILRVVTRVNYYGRCGDDTFYCILFGYNINGAKTLADNLRISIQSYLWETLAASLRVTCSIGIAEFHELEPVQDLIIRASIGFNKAKEAGRNRVTIGPEFLSKNQSRALENYYSR